MKKILYLIESDDPGGAENVMLALADHFRHTGHLVTGCLKRGWIYRQLAARGFAPKVIPAGRGAIDLKLLHHLVKLIKAEGIDLIHSHLFDINVYSSIAAKITGVPHLCTEHGDVHHHSKSSRKNFFKARILARCSDKIIFVSRFTKRAFSMLCKVPEQKSAVIYNGINTDNFNREADIEEKKAALGIGRRDPVVGSVGSLYPVKGQTYIIKAARLVLQTIPGVTFLIIGGGELEDKLKEESRRLDIEDRIRFTGFREDVHELLKTMDVFVLPSLSEGMPLSLIEAMASGLPAVASDVGGIGEVIDDGISGFVIPPADPAAFAAKILYLLQNPSSACEMGRRAREKVNERFNLRTMVENYERIYLELLAGK